MTAAPPPTSTDQAAELDALREELKQLKCQVSTHRRESERRLRNLLATVRSIVRRTVNDVATLEDYHNRLEGRINAFTRVQALLLSDFDAGIGLHSIVTDELLLSGLATTAVTLHGDDIDISAAAANLIVLLVHELMQMLGDSSADVAPAAELSLALQTKSGELFLRFEWSASRSRIAGEDKGVTWLNDALKYELGAVIDDQATAIHLRKIYLFPARRVLALNVLRDQFPEQATPPAP